jgi:hypothetical protein
LLFGQIGDRHLNFDRGRLGRRFCVFRHRLACVITVYRPGFFAVRRACFGGVYAAKEIMLIDGRLLV